MEPGEIGTGRKCVRVDFDPKDPESGYVLVARVPKSKRVKAVDAVGFDEASPSSVLKLQEVLFRMAIEGGGRIRHAETGEPLAFIKVEYPGLGWIAAVEVYDAIPDGDDCLLRIKAAMDGVLTGPQKGN